MPVLEQKQVGNPPRRPRPAPRQKQDRLGARVLCSAREPARQALRITARVFLKNPQPTSRFSRQFRASSSPAQAVFSGLAPGPYLFRATYGGLFYYSGATSTTNTCTTPSCTTDNVIIDPTPVTVTVKNGYGQTATSIAAYPQLRIRLA